MARNIRHFEPEGVYFITNRCAGGRFLLTPGSEVNRIIKGAMARYAARYDIELFGWLFMGNHFHLIPRSRSLRIPDFMRDMQRNISYEIQQLRDDWNSPVFPERYKCEPILDDAALRQKINYTLINPVRAGLVRHPSNWPGVTSYGLYRRGGSEEAWYLDRKRLRALKRKSKEGAVDPRRAMLSYDLELTAPPALQDRSLVEAGREVLSDVDATCRKWVEKQRLSTSDFLGATAVRRQDPLGRPSEPPEGAEPLCHTTIPRKAKEYRRQFANVTNRYREALRRWREGEETVSFPPGTYPPGWLQAVPHETRSEQDSLSELPSSASSDNPRGHPNAEGHAA